MRGNLPAEMSSLVGRAAEVRQVRAMLQQSRLVSLTGVGGVGKTRLARAVASDVGRAFKNGVWLVDLTSHTDGALVERSIRDVLPGSETAPSLAAQVGGQSLLVILDNCDRVAHAVASLLADWLPQCPAARVLTTTRTTLRVSGERIFDVTPLSVPVPGDSPLTSGAVELFRERVLALGVSHSIDFESPAVGELCTKLEGLPLAIELAAFRTTVLSVEEIIAGLQGRFELLAGGPADLPGHHQSLRALLHWSWERCSPPEKRLWARFAIFAGSATLSDLTTICELEQQEAMHLVDSLVRSSVMQRSEAAGAPRFGMLDTIREFGALMLATLPADVNSGPVDLSELRARHSAHYLRRVADVGARWFSPDQPDITAWTTAEMANIRLALETAAADATGCEAAAQGVADLWFYWLGCGHLDEGRFWSDLVASRYLSLSRPLPHRLLWVRGWIHLVAGDIATARRDLVASLTISMLHSDLRNAAYARALLGALHGFAGERRVFDSEYATAIALARQTGDDLAAAVFLVHQAEICSVSGRIAEAETLCLESEALCVAHGDTWCTAYTVWVKALCSIVRDDRPAAAAFAREAATLMIKVDDHLGAVLVSEVAAWALGTDDPARALTVLAATEHYWNMSGQTLLGFGKLVGRRDESLESIVAALSPEDVARCSAAGKRLGESGARSIVAAAFEWRDPLEPQSVSPIRSDGESSRYPSPLEALSNREREVAALVSRGLTNQQIADTLIIGRRTVDTHVSNILAKCGLGRRGEVAALISSTKST